MAEYIEREELLKKAIKERRFVFQMEDLLNSEVIFKTVYKDLAEFINSIPASDVAPVRHGRWADGKCTVCGWEEPDVCSYDGYEAESWIHTPYCPMCGALMDGCETDA